MDKEVLIAIIGSLAGLTALLKWVTPLIGKIMSNINASKVREIAISSVNHEESILENMIYIGQKFDFNYNHLIKFHNGGAETHELSIKKITIIQEFPLAGHLPKKKKMWYDRQVDFIFNKMMKFLMIDQSMHIEDIEQIQSNTGIRKVYNKANGGELLLVELGFIGVEYYFMCFQRDRKIPANRETPVLLNDRHIEEIQYRSKNIWDLCKNAKKLAS